MICNYTHNLDCPDLNYRCTVSQDALHGAFRRAGTLLLHAKVVYLNA
jgi:hypothetical protein